MGVRIGIVGEKGTSWGCGMTEVGHEGGNVVEFFDLHQMDPRHMFLSPRSRTRTGTYSVCYVFSAWGCAIHAMMSS